MRLFFILLFTVFLTGCETVNEVLGLQKKTFNEYTITTNNPLQYPPEHAEIKPYGDQDKPYSATSNQDRRKSSSVSSGEKLLFGDDHDVDNSSDYTVVSEGEKDLLKDSEGVADNPFAPSSQRGMDQQEIDFLNNIE
jgi:hypothetical protein